MDRQLLQEKILQGIPISREMAFSIDMLDDCAISVRGGADENINVHQTAFAGSLYCMCTLAVWGLVSSRLPSSASLVMADAAIKYLKPVKGEIVATATLTSQQMSEFLQRLKAQGKARLEVQAQVNQPAGIAVDFTATLYARIAN